MNTPGQQLAAESASDKPVDVDVHVSIPIDDDVLERAASRSVIPDYYWNEDTSDFLADDNTQ